MVFDIIVIRIIFIGVRGGFLVYEMGYCLIVIFIFKCLRDCDGRYVLNYERSGIDT